MEEQEILKKYKLSEQEHDLYYKIIKRTYTSGKVPVQNPTAVIIGGQTGAGKSGLIGYSTKMFKDGNVIIINSDEIKPFHPQSEEIARLYPKLYTKITDQESNTWTSQLFEELRREGYNIIFEGTMKNNRIADESITELEELGYTVVVRGLAVCDLESRMSILERYEGQVAKKGWGRLVVTDHHNQTYQGMPNTIDYIENMGRYDILEIFARGERPDEPICVYSAHNPESKDKIERVVSGKSHVSKHARAFGFDGAKDSVLSTRDEEYDWVIPTIEDRIRTVMKSMEDRNATDQEKQMVLELREYWQEIIKKKTKHNSIYHRFSIAEVPQNSEQAKEHVSESTQGDISTIEQGVKFVFQSLMQISSTDTERQMILNLMDGYQEYVRGKENLQNNIDEDAR